MKEPERLPGRDSDGRLRPWEFPGSTRRDCVPHRGPLLAFLGHAAFYPGLLALVLAIPVTATLGWPVLRDWLVVLVPAAVLALALGLAVFRMAKRDLRQMAAGLMDPAGRAPTIQAELWGAAAAFLGVAGCTSVALVYVFRG